MRQDTQHAAAVLDTADDTADQSSDDHAGDDTGDESSDDHAGDDTGDESSDDHAGDDTGNDTGDDHTGDHAGNLAGVLKHHRGNRAAGDAVESAADFDGQHDVQHDCVGAGEHVTVRSGSG